MNTIVTSREAILAVCRTMVAEQGIQAVNMRAVANACHVAVGSIYNYFPSKTDLIAATVQNVWQSIFHAERPCEQAAAFPDYVQALFQNVQAGAAAYPSFFTAHSLSFATDTKGQGRQMMLDYFAHMKSGLLLALQRDKNVSPDAFDSQFTQNDLVDFVFSNLTVLLMQQELSCHTLIEVIRRTIYA